MLNKVILMGRLTRDPELRRTGSGLSVANFSIAVDRDFSGKDGAQKEVDFIDCVAWRATADFLSRYFTKGRMIAVAGRLQVSSYTDKEGAKRRKSEVVVENAYFADRKKESTPAYPEGYSGPAQPGAPYAVLEEEDEGLPF